MAKKLNGRKLGPCFNLRTVGQILPVSEMQRFWFTKFNSIDPLRKDTSHVQHGPNDSRNSSMMCGLSFSSQRASSSSQWVNRYFVFWDNSTVSAQSLKWNDVENPVCLKLAVREGLIYHRGWEAGGGRLRPSRRLSTSTKATSVTLSHCLGK